MSRLPAHGLLASELRWGKLPARHASLAHNNGKKKKYAVVSRAWKSAEPTRDKNILGMYRRRGSNPPLPM